MNFLSHNPDFTRKFLRLMSSLMYENQTAQLHPCLTRVLINGLKIIFEKTDPRHPSQKGIIRLTMARRITAQRNLPLQWFL